VGSAIATIASIEIPRKEWLELIPNLSANSTHDSIDIRHAALETLGFICEELEPSDLNNELRSLIIQALVRNIEVDPSFVRTTLLAVRATFLALPYATQNFKVAVERDYIMTKLFSALTI
jgi:importin subunit beta-1